MHDYDRDLRYFKIACLYFIWLTCFHLFRILVAMGSNSVVDMIQASSKVHFSGFHVNGHVNGLAQKAVSKETISASGEIQRQPFVIGQFSFFYLAE